MSADSNQSLDLDDENPEIVKYSSGSAINLTSDNSSRRYFPLSTTTNRSSLHNPLAEDGHLFGTLTYLPGQKVPVLEFPPEADDESDSQKVILKPDQQNIKLQESQTNRHAELLRKGINSNTPHFMKRILRQGSIPTDMLREEDFEDDLQPYQPDESNQDVQRLKEKFERYQLKAENTVEHLRDIERSHHINVNGALKSHRNGYRHGTVVKRDEWSIPVGAPSISCFAAFCTSQKRSLGKLEIDSNFLHFYVDERDRKKRWSNGRCDLHIPLCCIETSAVFSSPVTTYVARYFMLNPSDFDLESDVLTMLQVLLKEDFVKEYYNRLRKKAQKSSGRNLEVFTDPIYRSLLFKNSVDVFDRKNESKIRKTQTGNLCLYLNDKINECTNLDVGESVKIAQLTGLSGILIDRIINDSLSPTVNEDPYGSCNSLSNTSPSSSSTAGFISTFNGLFFNNANKKTTDQNQNEREYEQSSDGFLNTESMEFNVLSSEDEFQPMIGFEFSNSEAGADHVLTQFHKAQLSHVLPGTLLRWSMLYCMRRDGISFQTLYSRLAKHDRLLLVIEDESGTVFGAFIPCEIQSYSGYYGSRETFLYTFRKDIEGNQSVFSSQTQDALKSISLNDMIKIYPWSARDTFVMFTDNHSIALGGAGGKGDFALTLDSDLKRGSSHRSETFNNEILSYTSDFYVRNLQFWACT